MMIWMQEYDAEVEAKAKAEIAKENAEWASMTEHQRQIAMDADIKRREENDARQNRIAAQHIEMFGEDDEECDDE